MLSFLLRTLPELIMVFNPEVVNAAIEAGATTINVPDTVGYTIPYEFGELFKHLISNCNDAENVIFSVHCHDDLGLSVANSLAAVEPEQDKLSVQLMALESELEIPH